MLELSVGREGQNSLPHESRSRVLSGKEKARNKGMLLDSYRPDLSFSSSVYSFFVRPNQVWTVARKLYVYTYTQRCSFIFSFFENRTGYKFVSNKINGKKLADKPYLKIILLEYFLRMLKPENYRISRFKAIWKFRVDWMTAEREKWLVRKLSRINEKRSRPVVSSWRVNEQRAMNLASHRRVTLGVLPPPPPPPILPPPCSFPSLGAS